MPRRPFAGAVGDLESLLVACREGRLYDVERWVAGGRPLQLAGPRDYPSRRRVTPLRVALDRADHALALLLLCNGYDPDREPYEPLEIALRARRPDLVELLLGWGADPHRVRLSTLFGTYDSALFERFSGLGVDLTARQGLAKALGYHSSNKPLYGFAKSRAARDPSVQAALDSALAEHAYHGRERGALLCLWAGADPHAPARSLPFRFYYDEDDPDDNLYPDDDSDDEGEEAHTALHAACLGGHGALVERFKPDPDRDDIQSLLLAAASAEVVDVLARFELARDVTAVVKRRVEMAGWEWDGRDEIGALQRHFELGAHWADAPKDVVGDIRRTVLRHSDHAFGRLVLVLVGEGACSPAVLRELGRTPAFQRRLRSVGLLPSSGDRGWRRRHGAGLAETVMRAFPDR